MYCKNCGKELKDDFKVCPYCGTPVDGVEHVESEVVDDNNKRNTTLDDYELQRDYEDKYRNNVPNNNDTGSFGWALLGFCFPFVGFILWLVWKDSKPITALKAGKAALWSMMINFVLSILMMCSAFMYVIV